ncbi:MAG: HAL/PAL/TAL family ammonia-lyase, partial [Thermoplasmata archaeon]
MVQIDGKSMNVDEVYEIAVNRAKIELSQEAMKRVKEDREKFEKLIDSDKAIYGVNTGFGSLLNVRVGRDMEKDLQKNLIRSHSAGYGEFLDETYVRAIMAVRANTLSKGYSAITPEMLEMLMEMVNKNVIPAVPRFGSVGASGDLAPLAHIGLAMMGEGYAFYNGKKYESKEALRMAGLKPYEFREKEGVALINGTSMMAGILSVLVKRSYNLVENAILSALLSFEGLNGTSKAFSSWIVESRPHHGQIYVAKKMMDLTSGSEIVKKSNETKVQDAYTLRCIPQVYGAVIDTINYVKGVV